MNNPKFRRISLHIHYCMSSAYILHHMITITCGKRQYMGKDAMVRAIFGLVSSDDGWRQFYDNRSVSAYLFHVRYVNVQYQISDFLEIVSIDILGHGGAMNIILPKNLF